MVASQSSTYLGRTDSRPPARRIGTVALLLLLLTLTAAGGQRLDATPSRVQAQEREALRPSPLPADVLEALTRDEHIVTDALARPEDLPAVHAALPIAERVLNVRREHQGDSWWETVDARWRLADLRLIARLPSESRATLAGIFDQEDAIAGLSSTGRLADAIERARALVGTQRQIRGADHPVHAGSLELAGLLCQADARHDEASALHEQALDIRRRTLGPDHPEYASSLNNLAVVLASLGGFERAEALYREALDTRRRLLGTDHPQYASSLNNLALLFYTTGRYREAEPLHREALDIRRKDTESAEFHAQSLNNLGLLYRAMGRFEEAEPLYAQALTMLERESEAQPEAYASALNNLAGLYVATGRYQEADDLYERARGLRAARLGESHVLYAASLTSLATLRVATGRYEDAIRVAGDAAAILERAQRTSHPDYATVLETIASANKSSGRYEAARPLYQRALDIRARVLGPAHPQTAQSFNHLAGLHLLTGDHGAAEPLLREAIAVLEAAVGTRHPTYATTLNNLAFLYQATGRTGEAQPLLRQALDIMRDALGERHSDYAVALNNLAFAHRALGTAEDRARAETLFREALSVLAVGHPTYATAASNLADLYLTEGRYAEAEAQYRRALDVRARLLGTDHPDYGTTLSGLGGVLALTGRPDAGAALLAATKVEWRHLTRNFPTMSPAQKRQFVAHSSFTHGERLASLVLQTAAADPETGLEGVLFSKQLLFDAARQESAALRGAIAGASPEWRELFRERERVRRQYASALRQSESTPRSPDAPSSAGQSVRDLAARLDQLEQALRQGNPAYTAAARLDEISLGDVKRAVRAGEALIEYLRYRPYDFKTRTWGDARYGAFVLRGGTGHVLAIDLGDAAATERAVEGFRTAQAEFIAQWKNNLGVTPSVTQLRRQMSEDPAAPGVLSETRTAQAASALRALVWAPLERALAGARRVYVAPDGALSLLPFEVLAERHEDGWRYLVEERELVYLGTGRDLGRLAAAPPAPADGARTAVLVGNPSFNAEPRQIAAAIAGLVADAPPASSKPARVRHSGGSTLGSITGGEVRHEIPRAWDQKDELATLIRHADEQLRKLGWTVTTLLDGAAVEETVRGLAAPRLLQLATHGYILDRAPDAASWDNPLLRSMVFLAGANRWTSETAVFYRVGATLVLEIEAQRAGLSGDALRAARIELADGVLTAYEVTGMNLQGTELVNLTACETGLGEVTPDGVAGLRQAFLLAGARALTMSMWEVPAQETTTQIRWFYDRWLGGGSSWRISRYAAFRETQLAALAEARKTHGYGHPFYWAGTVFIGDPGDLPHDAGTPGGAGRVPDAPAPAAVANGPGPMRGAGLEEVS